MLELLWIEGFDKCDSMSVLQLDISRVAAQSLLELLVAPPTPLLPVQSPLRRAAVDLIGRGFSVWEPHLEITKVILTLLEMATASEKPTQCVYNSFSLSFFVISYRISIKSINVVIKNFGFFFNVSGLQKPVCL